MIGIVIGAHGGFAPGLKSAADLVFGDQPNVQVVQLLEGMGPEDLYAKYNEAFAAFSADVDQVLVLVDFYGGTPFNIASKIQTESDKNIAILTGASMPILVEFYSSRDSYKTVDELADYLRGIAADATQVVLKSEAVEEEKDEFDDILG
ncbi:MAG: PTS sugar transporter subunit IIA [Bifidobacteriaceae bacterium]|jgi:PTS system mannose-specific IIB component|nr:PTS sugar transporter subunit IIA [Bifidobacteriaceae bacterium]